MYECIYAYTLFCFTEVSGDDKPAGEGVEAKEPNKERPRVLITYVPFNI